MSDQIQDQIAPTEAELQAALADLATVNTRQTTSLREVTYNFRKDQLGNKRASFKRQIPVPTLAGLVEIIAAGGAQLNLLLESAATVIYTQSRALIDDGTLSETVWDDTKLSWETIANLPPSERKGNGIPKEVWEAFAADYVEVMLKATNKTSEQVSKAAKLFVAKLQPVKTNKDVVSKLQEFLAVWFTSTANAEQFAEVYEFLDAKCKEFIETDFDQKLMDYL